VSRKKYDYTKLVHPGNKYLTKDIKISFQHHNYNISISLVSNFYKLLSKLTNFFMTLARKHLSLKILEKKVLHIFEVYVYYMAKQSGRVTWLTLLIM